MKSLWLRSSWVPVNRWWIIHQKSLASRYWWWAFHQDRGNALSRPSWRKGTSWICRGKKRNWTWICRMARNADSSERLYKTRCLRGGGMNRGGFDAIEVESLFIRHWHQGSVLSFCDRGFSRYWSFGRGINLILINILSGLNYLYHNARPGYD